MIQNFLKIALRTLRRNVTYSFINIAGLSVGIASSILILLWVHDELSFDNYFEKQKLIHQVKLNNTTDSGITTTEMTPLPLREALPALDSRIKDVSISVWHSLLITAGEKKISKRGLDVSENFIAMFGFKLIRGDARTALSDMRSIVITQSTARALFGDEDPMGKMVLVKVDKNEEMKVTGVMEDLPPNTSFYIDFLLPFSFFESTAPWIQYAKGNWSNFGFLTYVELQEGASPEEVSTSIHDIIKKNNNNTNSRDVEVFLHPMSHWRLYGTFVNGKESGGMIDYVILFGGIAVFILIIACINFMNLATARSEHRAREVGVRKCMGSKRKELVIQFIGESIMISGIAFMAAIVWVELALPFYNTLVNKTLFVDFASPLFWSFGLGLVFFTGILAGSYPAFYLSSFQPVRILKGRIAAGRESSIPRQVLVTLQFGFSIVLIIGTVVIYKQIEFLRNREVGYDRENLMLLWSNPDIERNYRPLKEELVNSGAALAVTKSNSPVTRIFSTSPLQGWTGMVPGQRVEVTNIATEYDYTKTLGVKLLMGRDFSPEFKSDTASMILNKTAVETLGLRDPLGDKIKMWNRDWTIIGVMDDVLMGSGSRSIDPLVMTMDPTWSTTITVRIPRTADVPAAVKKVEDIFKKYNPEYTFDYRFADTEFEQKFSTISMVSNLGYSFAMLAIFITALGLYGMAAFTAEQRTKEIGIRKVLGASVSGIVVLLSKDFSRLVLIAFLISAPIAWWQANDFLQRYQLRIEVPVWVFPVAGVLTLVITLMIVGTQAFRAANANPVSALRSGE